MLKLAREGKIDLDKPLYEYLTAPNIKDERYKSISARMVLGHTTGLPNLSVTDTITLLSEPGTVFSYSGDAYTYLARVVAELNGVTLKNLDSLFQIEVARELNLQDFHFVINPFIEANLATGYANGEPVYDERNREIFDPAGGIICERQHIRMLLDPTHDAGG